MQEKREFHKAPIVLATGQAFVDIVLIMMSYCTVLSTINGVIQLVRDTEWQ